MNAEALADFLAQYRGVRCRPDQVIVGAQLLSTISRIKWIEICPTRGREYHS